MTLRIQVLAAFYNQKKVWVGSLWKTAKAKRLLVVHFLKRWLRGIHQFSKLINRLKRLCVYFYYGANKSCSRAMWALDNQMQSVFFTASYVLNIRTFSWWSRVMSSLFIPMAAWKYAAYQHFHVQYLCVFGYSLQCVTNVTNSAALFCFNYKLCA